jgi:hypothetical protein
MGSLVIGVGWGLVLIDDLLADMYGVERSSGGWCPKNKRLAW